MLRPAFSVVLASASPRRQELLKKVFDDFEIQVSNVDEEAFAKADPWATAQETAFQKAHASARTRLDALVIGADTVVAYRANNEAPWIQLAKPADAAAAALMLKALSGRRHAVITGVALIWPEGSHEFCETSWVEFRELSEDEILEYVGTGEPLDKAGAYAIQGGAQGFVRSLEGDVSNVIGLPVEVLKMELIGRELAFA